MTPTEELLARLEYSGTSMFPSERKLARDAITAIRDLSTKLKAKEEERKLHERAAHDSDARCQAAVRAEKAERKARDKAEQRCKSMAKRFQQQGDECLARTEAAESRLATVFERTRERAAKVCEGYPTFIAPFMLRAVSERIRALQPEGEKSVAAQVADASISTTDESQRAQLEGDSPASAADPITHNPKEKP